MSDAFSWRRSETVSNKISRSAVTDFARGPVWSANRDRVAKLAKAVVKVDPHSVTLEPEFTCEVSPVAHRGAGDLEITLTKPDDSQRAKPLIEQSCGSS